MDNSLDIQCSLLGGYINNPDLFQGLEHLLRPKLFTHPVTIKSYEIIKDYHNRGVKPTIQSILSQLNKSGLKDSAATIVVKYSEYTYLSTEIIKEYVDQLFQDYTAAYLSDTFKGVIGSFSNRNPLEAMLKAKDAITNVELAYNNVSKDRTVIEVFDEAMKDILDMKNGVKPVVRFSWGIEELDAKTGGVADGPNILAATPGSGKSSMVVGMIVKNCIYDNKPFLIFSLEMKAKDLMKNIIANITEINSRSIREGNIDDEQLLKIKDVKNQLKLLLEIDETDGITWQMVEAKIRLYRKRHKIPLTQEILVAIDFIQKMRNSAEEMRLPQEERMGVTMNELARIAKNENVCLVEVSQFSRENSRRESPRPKLTDLKGSSAIEQNAVLALLMFRPELHGIKTLKNGESSQGVCEINIAKGRFVHPEPIYARFEGKYSRFTQYIPNSGINTSATESF